MPVKMSAHRLKRVRTARDRLLKIIRAGSDASLASLSEQATNSSEPRALLPSAS
jgi:hypothetical protein